MAYTILVVLFGTASLAFHLGASGTVAAVLAAASSMIASAAFHHNKRD